MLNGCNSWRQKCDQERSLEYFKIKGAHNRNAAHVECESKSDTCNNSGHWNHFKITQTILEQTHRENTKSRNYHKKKVGTSHILRKVLM